VLCHVCEYICVRNSRDYYKMPVSREETLKWGKLEWLMAVRENQGSGTLGFYLQFQALSFSQPGGQKPQELSTVWAVSKLCLHFFKSFWKEPGFLSCLKIWTHTLTWGKGVCLSFVIFTRQDYLNRQSAHQHGQGSNSAFQPELVSIIFDIQPQISHLTILKTRKQGPCKEVNHYKGCCMLFRIFQVGDPINGDCWHLTCFFPVTSYCATCTLSTHEYGAIWSS
jgi:hypothetical protein